MKVAFVIAFLALCSYGQNRVIDWHPNSSEQPLVADEAGRTFPSDIKALQIVEITSEGKAITPGQAFSAGDDWLKTFSIKVRNISDRRISSIRLSFSLPETKLGDIPSGFSLEYGKELSTGTDYGKQNPIEPGDEVVLMRNDRHYARDKEGIAKRSGVTVLHSVLMGAGMVKFVDGTLWMQSKLPFSVASTPRN